MLGRTAGIFLLSLLVVLPSAAQDFKKGLAAHKRGDYAAAMKQWRPLTDRGDAQAQYKLAFMFERGRGRLTIRPTTDNRRMVKEKWRALQDSNLRPAA